MGKIILLVTDRPGWACDKLTKPISKRLDNVTMSYFNTNENRFLATGYSEKGGLQFTPEMGNQFDIVHFHCVKAALMVIGKLKPKIKKVITINTERDDYKDINFDLFDDVICPTRFLYNRMIKRVKRAKVHYLPHFIDTGIFKRSTERPKSVGFVGRVVEHKRYPELQMASMLARFHFIGCGYIENGSVYKKNGLNDKSEYEFHIFYPDDKMSEFYAKLGLFICLSMPEIETGTLPILEAMACGVPVISTRIGWAKDNCKHLENIYFVEENELKSLPEIIQKVYTDKVLMKKLSDNAYNLIQGYGVKQYAEKLFKIYKG
jgi:glycosyltransferase involved in cell wall biosynthesis